MTEAIKKALVVSAAQIPLLGAAAAWWNAVLHKPVIAAGVFVVYQALLFTWVNIGKPVWEELKPQTVKVLASWVKVTAQNLFSGFRRRYLQQMIYDHRVFPVRGLLTPGQGALGVEKVFVELQIAPSHVLQVSANPIEARALSGSRPIWSFLNRLKKQKATALAILGPPGCGKTSLVKHTALMFSSGQHRRFRLSAQVPILLFLREHAKAIAEDGPNLGDLAQQYYGDPKRYPELDPPPFWFARQLRTGKCLVMLDGLDEVDAELREAVADWADSQIRSYPLCRFILTARPQGYRDAPLERAYVLEVLSFTAEQVEKFIHNWYLATKLIAYAKDDPGVRQDARREAEDLVQRLQERERLKELTVNPLLLTMIANVHNYRGALPERRVELYAEVCDVLLGHWQKAKGVGDRLTAAQKRVILQPLAEEMMKRKIREIDAESALEIMNPHLAQVGVEADDMAGFLAETQAASGLILEREAGVWGFAHLTFQEYLCASHWDKTGVAADWGLEDWQALIGDPWWHETLRLYGAQADANLLVEACAALNTEPALKLAANIAGEALKLEASLREKVQQLVSERKVIRLRRAPMAVSKEEFIQMFKLGEELRPLEYIQNDFEVQGEVVVDRATGLMWQQSGSDDEMPFEDAGKYIEGLNKQKFAGYDDWRLPTIDELTSLMEPEEKSGDLFIDPVFDKKQRWCWSSDTVKDSPGRAWGVGFGIGKVSPDGLGSVNYVRGVRS